MKANPDHYHGYEIAVLMCGTCILYPATDMGWATMQIYHSKMEFKLPICGTWKCKIVDGQRGWRYYSAKGVGA